MFDKYIAELKEYLAGFVGAAKDQALNSARLQAAASVYAGLLVQDSVEELVTREKGGTYTAPRVSVLDRTLRIVGTLEKEFWPEEAVQEPVCRLEGDPDDEC
jgi:hypothetical protein